MQFNRFGKKKIARKTSHFEHFESDVKIPHNDLFETVFFVVVVGISKI